MSELYSRRGIHHLAATFGSKRCDGGIAASRSLVTAAAAQEADASLPPSLAEAAIAQERGYAHFARRAPRTPGARAATDERERARRHSADGRHVAAYFSGIRWWNSERLFALVLPAKGEAFYVCPAFEEGRAREQIPNAPDGAQPDVRVWQENESPYERVAQGLKDRGIASGGLGIEETVHFVFADGIRKTAAQAELTSATPVTAGCRMIKTAHEIALMRLAAQVTLAAYHAAYLAVKDGMTQPQLEDLVKKAHARLGFTGGAEVQVGEFSAFPHGSVTPQVVHEGTIVLMDGGCEVEGYQSDITRTMCWARLRTR